MPLHAVAFGGSLPFMSLQDVQQKQQEAVDAIDAGDYAAAIAALTQAGIYLAGIPDQEQEDSSLRWRKGEMDDMIDQLRKSSGANTGVQRTKINWRRPTSCPTDCEC